MPPPLRVGLVQMACSKDVGQNVERACEGVRKAAEQGANIVGLQELFRSQYFAQTQDDANFDLAEPIPGPTTKRLSCLAKELGVVLVGSIFERRDAGVFHNSAVVLDADGSLAGTYRKMHIPDDPLYLEKFYFTPGDLGFRAFDTKVGRIGLQVCWDQWFPEGARLCALAGASILFYPTAIGWHPAEKVENGRAQLDAWQTVQRGHAIANGVFLAATNRVGHEGAQGSGLKFWGHSFVSDPQGIVLAQAGEKEEVLTAECDLDRLEEVRRSWPFLRDRRIDAYGGLKERLIGR